MEGKLIIFAAPSGSGKSTIINHVMQNEELNLRFSISCTSRAPRGEEQDGREYHFITPDEFRRRIADNQFVEYEMVYADTYYGTLRSEVDRNLAEGNNIVFDVDVNGARRIKEAYGKRALSIFIQPPSIDELRRRLEGRATDAPEVIEERLRRAEYELSCASDFDEVVINDVLEVAEVEVEALIDDFLTE